MNLDTPADQRNLLNILSRSEDIDEGVYCTVQIDKHLRDGSIVKPELSRGCVVDFVECKRIAGYIADCEPENYHERCS